MRFDLLDEEWAAIEPLLPAAKHGPARVDDRRVLNGIFYILRTGAPWRDLPERYGHKFPLFTTVQLIRPKIEKYSRFWVSVIFSQVRPYVWALRRQCCYL